MRRAAKLMIIGLVIFGISALGAIGASSHMIAKPASATPAYTTFHATGPTILVRWGRFHDRYLWGSQTSPFWGGYWSGGYYYPYYHNGNYGNRIPNYEQQYCWFNGFDWDCSPS